MSARMPIHAEVLRSPATGKFIAMSVVAAFCINLLPWQGTPLLVRPDFMLLTILYWCMHQPRHVGLATGFGAGILMDVAASALLGQHAVVYCLSVYLAFKFRLRVLRFKPWQQALHVAVILLLGQALMVLQNLVAGALFPGYEYFVASALGTLAWPLLVWLLEIPQTQPIRTETS